jgi:hypothetical protein
LAEQWSSQHVGFDLASTISSNYREGAGGVTEAISAGARADCHIFVATPAVACQENHRLIIHRRGRRHQAEHRLGAWGQASHQQEGGQGNEQEEAQSQADENKPPSPAMGAARMR